MISDVFYENEDLLTNIDWFIRDEVTEATQKVDGLKKSSSEPSTVSGEKNSHEKKRIYESEKVQLDGTIKLPFKKLVLRYQVDRYSELDRCEAEYDIENGEITIGELLGWIYYYYHSPASESWVKQVANLDNGCSQNEIARKALHSNSPISIQECMGNCLYFHGLQGVGGNFQTHVPTSGQLNEVLRTGTYDVIVRSRPRM